jgi:ankyrin repeat protein
MTREQATELLFKAAITGDVAKVHTALDAGADVNATAVAGATPLHFAALGSPADVVRLLIDKGADIHVKDTFGDRPFHWTVNRRQFDAAETFLKGDLLKNAAKQQGHAARVTEERKDKGPPQVG